MARTGSWRRAIDDNRQSRSGNTRANSNLSSRRIEGAQNRVNVG
jgi:hypothetical protein